MQKRILLLATSLLSTAAAYGFFPEATASTLEVGIGYRQDRLEWKTKPDHGSHSSRDYSSGDYYSGYDSYSSYDSSCPGMHSDVKWKNLRIWQIEALGKYVTCDHLYLRGSLDYGWITSGKRSDSEQFYGFEDNNDYVSFSEPSSKARGQVYDAKFAIGYLMQFCDNSFTFTPLIGYSWHGQHLHRHHHDYYDDYYENTTTTVATPAPAETDSSSSSSSRSGSHHKKKDSLRTRWNGPFIGFDFDYRFCCNWNVFGGYEFHWARYHAHGKTHNCFDNNNNSKRSFHQHGNSGIGSVIDIGVQWELCDWLLALRGEFQWWHVSHGKDYRGLDGYAAGNDCANNIRCREKRKLKHVKWNSAAIMLDAGIVF